MKKLLLITLLSLGILGCNNNDNKIESLSKEQILSHAIEYNLKDTTKNKINGIILNAKEIKFIDDLTASCKINKFDLIIQYIPGIVAMNVQGQTLMIGSLQTIQALNYIVNELRVKEYRFYKYNKTSDGDDNKTIYLIEGYNGGNIITNIVMYIDNSDYSIKQIDII